MFKNKRLLSTATLLLILISIVLPVFAANYTFTFTVNPQTTTAELGETISVDLGIADIDQSTQGINAIQGDISFDEELFESVNLVGAGNNWSVSYNNIEGSQLRGRFVLSNMNSVKDSQVIARLVVKIRDDATVTRGTITLKDVYSGSNSNEKTTKTITVNIQQSESTDDDSNKNIDNNNSIIDNGSSDNSKSKPSTAGQTSTSSSSKTLPKAGLEYWIGIFIVAAVIVAIIELIKYKRMMK